jgi:hypothetical protein
MLDTKNLPFLFVDKKKKNVSFCLITEYPHKVQNIIEVPNILTEFLCRTGRLILPGVGNTLCTGFGQSAAHPCSGRPPSLTGRGFYRLPGSPGPGVDNNANLTLISAKWG